MMQWLSVLLCVAAVNLFGDVMGRKEVQTEFCEAGRPNILLLQNQIKHEEHLVLGCQGKNTLHRHWTIPKDDETEMSEQSLTYPYFPNFTLDMIEIPKVRHSGYYYCANENALGQRYFVTGFSPVKGYISNKKIVSKHIWGVRGEHVVLPFLSQKLEQHITLRRNNEVVNVTDDERFSYDPRVGFTLRNFQPGDAGVYKSEDGYDVYGSLAIYVWRVSLAGIVLPTAPKPLLVVTTPSDGNVHVTCAVFLETHHTDNIEIDLQSDVGPFAEFDLNIGHAIDSYSDTHGTDSWVKKTVTWVLPREESGSGIHTCITRDVTGHLKTRLTSNFVCINKGVPDYKKSSNGNLPYTVVLRNEAGVSTLKNGTLWISVTTPTPLVDVIWYRIPNLNILGNNRTKYMLEKQQKRSSPNSFRTTFTLTVKDVILSDRGGYHAAIIHSGQSAIQDFVLSPVVLHTDDRKTVALSDETSHDDEESRRFLCTAAGYLNPKIIWTFTPCVNLPPSGCQPTGKADLTTSARAERDFCTDESPGGLPTYFSCTESFVETSDIPYGAYGQLECFVNGFESDGITFRITDHRTPSTAGNCSVEESDADNNDVTILKPSLAVVGMSSSIHCSIPRCLTNSTQFVWKLPRQRLNHDVHDKSNAATVISELEIHNISKQDAGKYTCAIPSHEEYVIYMRDISLDVFEPSLSEVYINNMRNYSVVLSHFDGDHELLCTVKGAPRPEIKWHKNGDEIPREKYYDMAGSEDGMAAISGVVIVPPDSGTDTYTCTATNSVGSRNTYVAISSHMDDTKYTVLRNQPPATVFNTYSTTTFPEKVVNMSVSVFVAKVDNAKMKMPPVQIIWSRLRSSTLYEELSGNSIKYTVSEYGADSSNITSELSVKAVNFPDSGEYFATVIVAGEALRSRFAVPVYGLWTHEPRRQTYFAFTACNSYGNPPPSLRWKFTPCFSAPPNGCSTSESNYLNRVTTSICLNNNDASMPEDVQCEQSSVFYDHSVNYYYGRLTCFVEGNENDGITFDITVEGDMNLGPNYIYDYDPDSYITRYKLKYPIIGKPLSLYCAIPFFFIKEDAKFRWEKEGYTITAGNADVSDASNTYNKMSMLVIHNATTADSGIYTCIIESSYPKETELNESIPVDVKVPVPPTVTSENMNNDNRMIYGAETLKCTAQGYPPPTIEWRKDGQLYPNAKTEASWEDATITESEIIVEPPVNGQNEYTCTGVNAGGRRSTSVIVHAETQHPEIVSENLHNGSKVISILDNSILKCVARGIPSPRIEWQRNSEVYAVNDTLTWTDGELVTSAISAQPSEEPFDIFSCTATNSHGNTTAYVNVTFDRCDKRSENKTDKSGDNSHTTTIVVSVIITVIVIASAVFGVMFYRQKQRKLMLQTAALPVNLRSVQRQVENQSGDDRESVGRVDETEADGDLFPLVPMLHSPRSKPTNYSGFL